MRLLIPTAVLFSSVALAACSGSSSGPSGSSLPPTAGQVRAATTLPSALATGEASATIASTGSFCADFRSLTVKAAEIARSLTTFTPDQVHSAITADLALQQTAAGEAPGAIRSDVVLASDGPQFAALEQAGYDLRKVDPAKFELSTAQEAALGRVQTFVIAQCGFDPKQLMLGNK